MKGSRDESPKPEPKTHDCGTITQIAYPVAVLVIGTYTLDAI